MYNSYLFDVNYMKHLDNEVITLLWGKIIPSCIGENDQYFFYCRRKSSENLRFSGEKRFLSIQICVWFLFKNIKKFGR